MGQGDWDGDKRDGFRGQGEFEGDRSDGSRGQGDWEGERREGSRGPGDGSLWEPLLHLWAGTGALWPSGISRIWSVKTKIIMVRPDSNYFVVKIANMLKMLKIPLILSEHWWYDDRLLWQCLKRILAKAQSISFLPWDPQDAIKNVLVSKLRSNSKYLVIMKK